MKKAFTSHETVIKYIAVIFFVGISVWWFTIYGRGLTEGNENNAFTLIYPLLSLFGGIIGLAVAKKWGGFESFVGKGISFFSFGLLAQFFGQACYAYLIYIRNIEVPYPSIGDIGYFGSVLFYIAAIYFIGRAIGVKYALKGYFEKLLALLFAVAILAASYSFFLKGYEVDWTYPLTVILDFGYPLGQAIYVALALLFLIVSVKHLGGKMKMPIIAILVALAVQYLSDFTFLYQASQGTWYVAGINDYLYFCSYFLMTMSLLYTEHVFEALKES